MYAGKSLLYESQVFNTGKTPIAPPKIKSIDELLELSGFRSVNICYNDINRFLKIYQYEARKDKHQLWEQYKNTFVKQMHSLVSRIMNSSKNKVVFFRPFLENQPIDDLIEQLKILQGDYKIIKYFGSLDKEEFHDKTIKEVVDQYISEGDDKILIIAGGGRSRCGDSFPKECATFIDMSVESCCNWNSGLQGTLGRSMGYDKESTCYFLSKYCEDLLQFINGSDNSKNYGLRDSKGRQSTKTELNFNLQIQ